MATTDLSGYARNPVTGEMQFVGRLKRPSYYCDSSGTVVKVDAKNQPLLIGNTLYKLKSDLRCNLANNGAGGLDVGTIAANTPYYLYIVDNSDSLSLVASVRNPDTGPSGWKDWTYIGSCGSDDSVARINNFNSSGGFYLTRQTLEEKSETASAGSYEAKTFNVMPVTATKAYVQVRAYANNAGGVDKVVYVSGEGSYHTLIQQSQVEDVGCYVNGWVYITTPKTLWIYISDTDCPGRVRLFGWHEDPTEWA
jgi:hypothetical protein